MNNRQASTSIPEQAIYYYVSRCCPDALNRYRFRSVNNETYEADIYIPSLKMVIEYDGEYWHAGKEDKDKAKRDFFFSTGLFAIIVREGYLPEIAVDNGVLLRHKARGTEGMHMYELVVEIIHIIGNRKNCDQLKDFSLSYEQYCEDYPDILKRIFTKSIDDNVTKSCAFVCWDHEKNKGIDPSMIPFNTSAKFWYRCPDGQSFRTSPREWKTDSNCDKKCTVCAYLVCPFVSMCPPFMKAQKYCGPQNESRIHLSIDHPCQYIQQYIRSCASGAKEWPKKYASQIRMMLAYTDDGPHMDMELVRIYCDGKTTQETKQRIAAILSGDDDLSEGTGYSSREAKEKRMEALAKKWEPEGKKRRMPIPERPVYRLMSTASEISELKLLTQIVVELNWNVVINLEHFQDTVAKQDAACFFIDWFLNTIRENKARASQYVSLITIQFGRFNIEDNYKSKITAVFDKYDIPYRDYSVR